MDPALGLPSVLTVAGSAVGTDELLRDSIGELQLLMVRDWV